MDKKTEPTRVQFQIGKSAPINLQQWVKNQSLPINKAVREVLNHFVYVYGTGDILSEEVRQKMSLEQSRHIPSPTAQINETSSNTNQSNIYPDNNKGNIKKTENQPGKRMIRNRDIDI